MNRHSAPARRRLRSALRLLAKGKHPIQTIDRDSAVAKAIEFERQLVAEHDGQRPPPVMQIAWAISFLVAMEQERSGLDSLTVDRDVEEIYVRSPGDREKLQRIAALLHDAKHLLTKLEYPNDDDVKHYECLASEATDGIDVALDAVIKATELAK